MSAETIANKAFKQGTKALFDYDKHWASCFEPAPFLPMSRAEMDALGWDACDVIIVSGDAYTSITQALVWQSSADCWSRKAFASVSSPNPTGRAKTLL